MKKEAKSKRLVRKLLEYYTQEELAVKIKTSFSTISRWKNPKDSRKPNYPTYKYLKQILNGVKTRRKANENSPK